MRFVAAAIVFMLTVLGAAGVRAGGFSIPDTGTVALGRGGAFTAKADDGTALVYNIAGLARQRGTRLTLDLNLLFSDYEFQRAGVYPDDPKNVLTPWGGKPYAKVANTGGLFAAPYAALSTDFGVLDRWTFALGIFGPASVGNRTYPLTQAGFPSASRYDVVQALSTVFLPTAAAAVRITRWLDFGVALHVVYGTFNLSSDSFTDVGCPNPEYEPCDSVNHLQVSGTTVTGSAGVMVRPTRWFELGVNVRGPFTIHASGTVNATSPMVAPMPISPAPATFEIAFPWFIRYGLRLVKMRQQFELADLEVDGTYETWGTQQATGPQVSIPMLSIFTDIHSQIVHHYHDTFSARLGGAVHARLPAGVLSFRAGGYFDSSATDPAYTRLDFDTLPKVAGTAGIGYRVRGIAIDLSYAYIYGFPRTVTDGQIRPIDGAQHGMTVDSMGNPLPPINNGNYTSRTQILSLGLGVTWDELFGSKRRVRYGAAYEVASAEPSRPPPMMPAPPAPPPPPVQVVPPPVDSAPPVTNMGNEEGLVPEAAPVAHRVRRRHKRKRRKKRRRRHHRRHVERDE